MATCAPITLTGFGLDCGSIGGLSTIYITDRQNVSSVLITGGEVSGITMASSAVTFTEFNFKKNNANFVSTGNRSDENGTLYYETVLEAKFNHMETAKRTDMTEIAKGNTLVIAKDQNGLYWFIGWSQPDVNTYVYGNATANTGAAMGDANQYILTLTAMTPELPYQLTTNFNFTGIVS